MCYIDTFWTAIIFNVFKRSNVADNDIPQIRRTRTTFKTDQILITLWLVNFSLHRWTVGMTSNFVFANVTGIFSHGNIIQYLFLKDDPMWASWPLKSLPTRLFIQQLLWLTSNSKLRITGRWALHEGQVMMPQAFPYHVSLYSQTQSLSNA